MSSKKSVNNIVKKIIVSVFSVLCAVIVFFAAEIDIYNDGAEAQLNRHGGRLVTRTQVDNRGFFSGKKADSGILLSWYDNTVKIADEDEEAPALKLGAIFYPVTTPDSSLIFSSSNNDIAQIDNEGNITVITPGSVEFVVENTYSNVRSKAYLHIVQPVTGFYLNKTTLNVYTTDKGIRLDGEISPSNASNAAVKWYSKDKNIVQVDNTGHIKPMNIGMTEVVATTSDGGFRSKCFINVIEKIIKAESVIIQNKENITLKVGETWDGVASVLPANAKNRNVEWMSENEDIARVSKTGKVRAFAQGSVKITARNTDGPEDSFMLTVKGNTVAGNDIILGYNSYTSPGGITYTKYDFTVDDMARIQTEARPPATFNGVVASKETVLGYVDPNEYCAGAYKYQFMDLAHYNGLSRESIEQFLSGKGTLSGQADAFIEAAREYNVSELYLIAHACLETGYGRSQLASGVDVNGVTVYNMYGIAAYDGSVVYSGSRKAYAEGWTSPAAAIKGGAKWISENYINSAENRQNTLYKMRWNPANPGVHLYAGDCAWATTQSVIMERLIKEFPDASMAYEIPVFAGSPAAVIDDAVTVE